jgi:hypothetical protein
VIPSSGDSGDAVQHSSHEFVRPPDNCAITNNAAGHSQSPVATPTVFMGTAVEKLSLLGQLMSDKAAENIENVNQFSDCKESSPHLRLIGPDSIDDPDFESNTDSSGSSTETSGLMR